MDTHENELDLPPAEVKSDTQTVEKNTHLDDEVVDINWGNEYLKGTADISKGGTTLTDTSKITQSQEKTRARIALTFTQIFLFLVSVAFIMPTVIHTIRPDLLAEPTNTTKELVTTIASILAGPFGFIVGFYFKKDSN